MIVTATGRPVEGLLLCGCRADLIGLQEMALDLPAGAQLYGDKAYTDYDYEQQLQTTRQIRRLPLRKSNARRQHTAELTKTVRRKRKRLETT